MATTNNKSKNTNDNTSQGPQIGSMYIVDGAIYKCSGGLIISKIVSDKAKVYMQKNAMITTDDKKFSNSFGNCTLQPTTPSGPPPCSGYTSLEWQQDATIDTKNNNLPTENSKLQCKAGGGIVSCLNPGQIQSIGKLDFESVKYENSLFPYSPMTIEFDRSKCLFRPFGVSMTKAFRFPPEKKEKEEFKMREVQIRKTEQLQFCAYEDKNGKIEIKDKPINWAVCQIEEVKPEQTDKNKAIKYRLKKVTMYRNVLGIFDYKFDDAGKYIVEGMGNKETLDNYLKMEEDVSRYNLKKEKKQLTEEEKEATNYNWENIKKTDKNCTMRFEVLPNNSITGLWSGKRKIDETKPIYVKQKEEKVITAKLTFPFDSKYDEMECFVTNSLGQKLFESEYKLSENNQQITLTPVNADVVYNIQFRLYSKDNASKSGEKPISEKNIIVHSYNDAVLHVYAPTLDTTSLENSVAINSENLILSRPGETLAFYVTADQSINNDHVILSVKKIEDPISQYITEKDTIKGGRLYLFRKEGFYIVEADLKNTVYSNGGVKVDDKDGKIAKGDCTEREITHTIEIAEHIVTKISVKSTCGEWYAGVVYPIALNFKYGKSTRLNEEKAVQMQLAEPSGIVAENLFNDNRKRRFLADSPGEYTIKGVLNGVECLSDVIKVVEPTFIKWEFCDSKKNKITRTARGLKFGINGNVPAWSLIDGENETQKRLIHVVLSVSVRGDNNSVSLEPIIADLDKRGCFNVENIDVKEVIEKAKKQNLFEESNRIDEDLIIKFLVFQAKNDSGKDQNLSTSIKDLSGDWIKGLQSINTSLTVTRKFFIDGYFTEGEGRKLVNVLRYGDEVNVHLHILNAPDILLKNMELHVYEDKPENDEVVFKKEKNIELDSDGCVDIQIPTNDQGIKESDHGESLLPRLFYFKVVCPDKEDLKEFVSLNQCIVNDNFFRLFVYPISPGELHAYNVRALLNGDKPVDDFEEKKKEALDYYYQLKLLPKGKEEKDFIDTYNKLGPVVVGKDFDSPDFCRGNKCMTMANYRSMKNASQLVKEINIRLAGFGGDAGCPLPSDSFSYRTERAIRQFQRDVMGIQPTGRICGSLLKAIDEFCENKDYDINFGQLKCKCGKCGGFGKGGKNEYPGMHRSLLFVLKAFLFYLKKEKFLFNGKEISFEFCEFTDGYRCNIRNDQVHRESINHMGNAIDMQLNLIEGKNKCERINSRKSGCLNYMNLVRKQIFIDRMRAAYSWALTNNISIELGGLGKNGYNADSWIHFDVREFNEEYKTSDLYIKDKSALCPQKLMDIARDLDLCKCTSTKEKDVKEIVTLVMLENDGRKPISEWIVPDKIVSDKCLQFIKGYEGFRNKAYDDNPKNLAKSYLTIGYGCRICPIEGVSKAIFDKSYKNNPKKFNWSKCPITKEEYEEFDKSEAGMSEERAAKIMLDHIEKVDIPQLKKDFDNVLFYQHEIEALVSLNYNYKSNTSFDKKAHKLYENLTSGKYYLVSNEFLDIGKEKGLKNRRKAEQKIFDNGIYEVKK